MMSKYSLDQFLEACGAAGPLRLTIEDGDGVTEHILQQPFAVAGTDQRADIRPADGRVPRRAAYLQVLAGRLLCMDLTVGVRDRPGRFPPHQWLDKGAVWPCGSMSVRLAGDKLGGTASSDPMRRENLLPMTVEISGGSKGVCAYALKGPLTLIGKSSECQVRLRDKAVSRFHCAMVHTGATLWVVDLLGRGGVMVNGAVTRVACLDDGDELRVGGFAFRPRPGPPQTLVPRGADDGALRLAGPPPLVESLPMPAVPGPIVGADFAPFVSLFTTLQQQMADHFRSTMTGMMESFQRMHADQMRLVWEELAHIRRLSDEVTSLKESLARLPAAPVTDRKSGPSLAAGLPADSRQRDVRPSAFPKTPPVEKTPLGPSPHPVRKSEPTVSVSAPSTPSGDDVHTWLNRRVAEVQQEREGRWEKIVSFLKWTPR